MSCPHDPPTTHGGVVHTAHAAGPRRAGRPRPAGCRAVRARRRMRGPAQCKTRVRHTGWSRRKRREASWPCSTPLLAPFFALSAETIPTEDLGHHSAPTLVKIRAQMAPSLCLDQSLHRFLRNSSSVCAQRAQSEPLAGTARNAPAGEGEEAPWRGARAERSTTEPRHVPLEGTSSGPSHLCSKGRDRGWVLHSRRVALPRLVRRVPARS